MELALPTPVEMVLEEKGRRTHQISVQEKLNIVQRIKGGTPRKDICKEYGIPHSTLSSIIKNEEKYRSALDSCMVTGTAKRVRLGHYPLLEGILRQWAWETFQETGSFAASLQQIKEKAQELAPSLGITGFKGGHSWVSKVAQRLRQALLSKDVPELGIAPNMSNFRCAISDIFKTYTPDDIFFADEIGLFYRLLPNDVAQYVGQSCKKGDKASDRITLMAASNICGKEKLRLLVVSRLKFPKTTNPLKSLPVVYEQDVNSWMTQEVFHNWITQLDSKMKESQRKIVVFVRNTAIHTRKDGLEAVRLEYVPKEVFAVLQEILQNLKMRYRQRLLEHTLLNIEYKKPLEVTLLRALYVLASVWADIKSNQIREAFLKAGFFRTTNSLPSNEVKGDSELEIKKEHDCLFSALKEKGLKIEPAQDFNSYCSCDDSLVVSHSLAEMDLVKTEVDMDCDDMMDVPEVSIDDDFLEEQMGLLLFPKMTMTELDNTDSLTAGKSPSSQGVTSPIEIRDSIQEASSSVSEAKYLPQKRNRGRPKKTKPLEVSQSSINLFKEIELAHEDSLTESVALVPPKRRTKRRAEEPSSSTPNLTVSSRAWVDTNTEETGKKSSDDPYCLPVTRFEEVLEDDDVVIVKHAIRPMARHHFVLVLKHQELNIWALRDSHLTIVEHMHRKALEIAKNLNDTFIIGFHAVPSIFQLTLHVLSLDLCSPFMDSKSLYNSFTTQYFMTSEELLDQLKATSRVEVLSMAMLRETLQTPLRCHICEIPQLSIESLKAHLVEHTGERNI